MPIKSDCGPGVLNLLDFAKRCVRRITRAFGFQIVSLTSKKAAGKLSEFPADFDVETVNACRYAAPYTMTSSENVYALRQAVEYVVANEVPGDVVECGVWKGGSMMVIAQKLLQMQSMTRKLYLFDTFEGMSKPDDVDRTFRGTQASEMLQSADKSSAAIWAYSPLEDVKKAMFDTGYDKDSIVFVKGKVEETLPERSPDRISLLRLDTDWYESTFHELTHLYPRLSVGGVLVIDDYGHWQGARRAVDQYIAENNLKLLLHRIDYTARICVKLEE